MKKHQTTIQTIGSICADEVVDLVTFQRRFSLAYKSTALMQRLGLRMVEVGKKKFILGSDAISFFQRLAERQANGNGPQTQESKNVDSIEP